MPRLRDYNYARSYTRLNIFFKFVLIVYVACNLFIPNKHFPCLFCRTYSFLHINSKYWQRNFSSLNSPFIPLPLIALVSSSKILCFIPGQCLIYWEQVGCFKYVYQNLICLIHSSQIFVCLRIIWGMYNKNQIPKKEGEGVPG